MPLPTITSPIRPGQILPEVAPELLRYLETTYPLAVHETLDDYRRMEGRQQVIEHLRTLVEGA